MQRQLQVALELNWTQMLLFLMRMKMGVDGFGLHLGIGWLGALFALGNLLLQESEQGKCIVGRNRP